MTWTGEHNRELLEAFTGYVKELDYQQDYHLRDVPPEVWAVIIDKFLEQRRNSA